MYEFRISGKDLPIKDALTSDPYFTLETLRGEIIYKSKVKKKNLNPIWEEFKLTFKQLSYNLKSEIKVIVKDYDFLSKDDYMGTGYFNVDSLIGQRDACRVELFNEKSRRSAGYLMVRVKDVKKDKEKEKTWKENDEK